MIYTDKSELLLKYQKTKAKLIEFDVPNDLYPNFPLDSNDLSFLTVYLLSLYSESIIGKDDNRQRELKPLLIKEAQFFDSVFESKDRPQRNQDFWLLERQLIFLIMTLAVQKFFAQRWIRVIALLILPLNYCVFVCNIFS